MGGGCPSAGSSHPQPPRQDCNFSGPDFVASDSADFCQLGACGARSSRALIAQRRPAREGSVRSETVQADVPDFELVFQSEPRPPQAGKTVRWTVLSGEYTGFRGGI